MRRVHRVWPLVAALLALLILPNFAQAKRFKRYPDDVKAQQEKAQPRQPVQRETDNAGEDVEDYGYYGPEDPPGCSGTSSIGNTSAP